MADFYAARDSTMPPLPWPSIAPPITYTGQQDAIVDLEIFNQVQALINANAPERRQAENQTSPHLLTGLLFDETGDALSPTHAVKNGKRYRYYTSHRMKSAGAAKSGGWRLAAEQIENTVLRLLCEHLSDRGKFAALLSSIKSSANQMLQLADGAKQLAGELANQTQPELKSTINNLVQRVELKAESITIQVSLAELCKLGENKTCVFFHLPKDALGTIIAPLQIKKRGVETKLIIGDNPRTVAEPNQALIMLVAQAHHWLERLTAGSVVSIIKLAREEQVDKNKISRALRFAYLAPDITLAILEGSQPVDLTAETMRRLPELPMDWQDQRNLLGFA